MGPGKPMSSTTATKSYMIPKLAKDGSNWITWKSQMLATLVASCGVMRHIEGTARQPTAIPTYPTTCSLTTDEEDCLEQAERCWDDYHQCEATVKVQIFTTIPKVLLIEVQKLRTAKEVWDAVCIKHKGKALAVKVDIWCQMYKMKCEC